MPDLGIEGDHGILDVHKKLMTLRNQDDPVIVIREEEGKFKRKSWVEDDEIMCDLDNGPTRHISRDNTLYTDRSHTTQLVCGQK